MAINTISTAKNKNKRKDQIYTALPQVIAVSIKNVLLLAYGMTLGFPTIVIPTLQGGYSYESLVLTAEQISWISSINLICVPLGCLLSGVVTQPLGRKRSMQLVNIPFFIAWLVFHFSTKVDHLYMALCLTGLTGGLLEAPVLTYVAEITQPNLRGMLSATSSMTIIFGVFCQFLLGTFLYWRTVALVNIAFPILSFVLLFLVPESPHWLIQKNRLEEAKKSLAWLRGWTTIHEIEPEYKELCAILGKSNSIESNGIDNPAFVDNDNNINSAPVIKSNKSGSISRSKIDLLKKFGTKSFGFPYCLICFTFFLGHFSGMTTLQTFAVQIFQTLKSPIDKYYATLLLGIVELSGSLICVITVHYVGKRPLTFLSTIGCGICFIIVATYAHLINVTTFTPLAVSNSSNLINNSTTLLDNSTSLALSNDTSHYTIFDVDISTLQWLPLTFLIGSALLSHVGIRLLPWILIGECFPAELRAIASGLAGGMGYIFGFSANKVFLTMINNLTIAGTFWLYGCISLIGTVILFFTLPETEGRTLHDIELHFSGVKKIKLNAGIYKKPKNNSVSQIDLGEINQGFVDKTVNEHMDSKL